MVIKRLTHITLAFLLLFSTTGITVSRHYCGGHLRSVSLVKIPAACCDTEGCCHNDIEQYRLDDDFSLSAFTIDFEQEIIPARLLLAYNTLEPLTPDLKSIYSDRPSPPGVRLFLSSIQTFRL